MGRIPGALALVLAALPAAAGAPPGCTWLCGTWVLDSALSDPAEPAVDAALKTYRERRPRSSPRHQPVPVAPEETPAADSAAESARAALRAQLLAAVEPPASLDFGEQGEVILIRVAGGEQRRAYPGEPHSRVTAQGTTKISTDWKKDTLIVAEDNGGRSRSETYALLPDGTLQLTRVVQRPDLGKLQLRAIYRRGQGPGLESGSQERPQDSAR